MDYELLHEKMIYPIVQINLEKSGGSGTVIHSRSHDDGETYDTYVLTNHHVIKSAIKIEDKYQPVYGRKLPWEERSVVDVCNYVYNNVSFLETRQTNYADIVAWDESHDIALLYMRTEREFPYVVDLYDADRIKDLRMMMPLVVVGCSLLHKPLHSRGEITSLDETAKNIRYFMSCTLITFGNSGGAIYLADTMEFLGIPSMMDVVPLGFGGSTQNFLNYFIPIHRIRDILGNEWHFEFLFDDSVPKEECEARRKKKQDLVRQTLDERFRRERVEAMDGQAPIAFSDWKLDELET